MSKYEKMIGLLFGIANTWPLFVVCLLLAFISGFAIWALEKRKNAEEFPNRVVDGIAEGFWWSVISMTTVGRCFLLLIHRFWYYEIFGLKMVLWTKFVNTCVTFLFCL